MDEDREVLIQALQNLENISTGEFVHDSQISNSVERFGAAIEKRAKFLSERSKEKDFDLPNL